MCELIERLILKLENKNQINERFKNVFPLETGGMKSS